MKRLPLLLILTLILGSSAQAATIYLKDGTQLRGTIVSATAADVQIHTANGSSTVTTDRIQRIDYAEPEPQPQPVMQPAVQPVRYETLRRPEGRQLFSLGLGAAVPLSRVDFRSAGGGTDDNGNTGFLIGTQYLYGLTSRWSVGGNLEYFNRSMTSSQSLLPESDTNISGDTLVIMPTLKFSLIDHGYARPYVLGGVGTNRTSTVAEATPNFGFSWSDTNTAETRTLVDDAHWGFASTLRFGVDFELMDPSVFSLEFGWTRLSNGTYAPTPSGQDLGLNALTGNQNVMTIAARWGWRF